MVVQGQLFEPALSLSDLYDVFLLDIVRLNKYLKYDALAIYFFGGWVGAGEGGRGRGWRLG